MVRWQMFNAKLFTEFTDSKNLKNIKNQPRFPCPSNIIQRHHCLVCALAPAKGREWLAKARRSRPHSHAVPAAAPHHASHSQCQRRTSGCRLCAKHPTAQKYSENVKTNRPQEPCTLCSGSSLHPPAAIQHKNCWCLQLQLWVRNFLTRVTGA